MNVLTCMLSDFLAPASRQETPMDCEVVLLTSPDQLNANFVYDISGTDFVSTMRISC
jgi:hypothetical protein